MIGFTLLTLLIVALMSVSVGAIFSVWIGGITAGFLLLLSAPLGRWIQRPLRIGRLPLAGLAPLVWLATAGGYFVAQLEKAPITQRKATFQPLVQDLVATARVNRTHLRVEKDSLVYTLTVRHKQGLKPKIPKITAHPTFNRAFVMPADSPPRIRTLPAKNGIVTKQWTLTLTPVASGPLDTPKFVIRYTQKGKSKKVIVPSIAIEVSELGKPSQLLATLRPAKAPVLPERPDTQTPWIWLGVLSSLFLVSFAGIAWVRRRDRYQAPPLPPHEWVEQELQRLNAQNLLKQGLFKVHYFALSELFRGFLERRYEFTALESTTEEIIQWCKQHDVIAQDIYRDIRKLLQWMDSVKFAGHDPGPEENEETEKRLHSVLRRTRPAPSLEQKEQEQA